jgi:hypothetical protein
MLLLKFLYLVFENDNLIWSFLNMVCKWFKP